MFVGGDGGGGVVVGGAGCCRAGRLQTVLRDKSAPIPGHFGSLGLGSFRNLAMYSNGEGSFYIWHMKIKLRECLSPGKKKKKKLD